MSVELPGMSTVKLGFREVRVIERRAAALRGR